MLDLVDGHHGVGGDQAAAPVGAHRARDRGRNEFAARQRLSPPGHHVTMPSCA
jgi:hypothetical protein